MKTDWYSIISEYPFLLCFKMPPESFENVSFGQRIDTNVAVSCNIIYTFIFLISVLFSNFLEYLSGVFVKNSPQFQVARVARTTAQQRRDFDGQQTVATAKTIDRHRRDLHAVQPVRPAELATDAVCGPRLLGPEDQTGLAVARFGPLRPAQRLQGQCKYCRVNPWTNYNLPPKKKKKNHRFLCIFGQK